jgi:hypothetical protein
MKFSCDKCGKRFSSSDEPVPGRLYRIQCKCGNVISVRGGDTPREPTPAPVFVVPPPRPAPAPAPAPRPAEPSAAGPRRRTQAATEEKGAAGSILPEMPPLEGDPFSAAVSTRSAHPAATSDVDLGLTSGPAAPATPARAPRATADSLFLETPTPAPAAPEAGPERQGFPSPRPFSEPDVPLEIDTGRQGYPAPLPFGASDLPLELDTGLGGAIGSGVPQPADDPFARASGMGQSPAPLPSVTAPLSGPSRIPPPSFTPPAREESVELGVKPSIGRPPTRSRRGPLVAILVSLLVLGGALGAWWLLVTSSTTSTTTASVGADAVPPPAPPRAASRPKPAAAPPAPAPATLPPTTAAAPEPVPPPAAVAPPAPEPKREPAPQVVRKPKAAPVATPAPPPDAAATTATAPAPAAEAPPAPPPAPKPAPVVAKATAPAGVKAALEPTDVVAVIKRNRAEFDGCVTQAAAGVAPPIWLGRRVELLVLVNPNGRVSEPIVDDPEIEPIPLGACLRRVAAGMTFPAFQGEAVPVAIPLRLGKVE